MSHFPIDQSLENAGPQPPQLKAGQLVFNQRYELKKVLGAGGMGVVWLARDTVENLPVAMKFVPGILVLQPREMERIREEVRTGKNLRHPRLVSTYALEIEGGVAAVVMEYIEGETLKQKLETHERGFFEPDEITGWILDIADGLGYLHVEGNRIHRDIKPSNVIIDSEGRARLLDFGISLRISESFSRHSSTVHASDAGSSAGTLVYSSPQQLNGLRPDVTDDVYALAATLFDLLTGTPPFFRGDLRGQIHSLPCSSIANRRQDLVEEGVLLSVGAAVPAIWEKTLAEGLAKEKEQRPASVAAFVGLIGLKSAYSDAPSSRLTSARKATPKKLPWAAAAIVMGLSIAAFMVWQQRQGTMLHRDTITAPLHPVSSKSATEASSSPATGKKEGISLASANSAGHPAPAVVVPVPPQPPAPVPVPAPKQISKASAQEVMDKAERVRSMQKKLGVPVDAFPQQPETEDAAHSEIKHLDEKLALLTAYQEQKTTAQKAEDRTKLETQRHREAVMEEIYALRNEISELARQADEPLPVFDSVGKLSDEELASEKQRLTKLRKDSEKKRSAKALAMATAKIESSPRAVTPPPAGKPDPTLTPPKKALAQRSKSTKSTSPSSITANQGGNAGIMQDRNAGEQRMVELFGKSLVDLAKEWASHPGYFGAVLQDTTVPTPQGNLIVCPQVINMDNLGPAAFAGIIRGDIILSINNQLVGNTPNFVATIKSITPGTWVNMQIMRNGAVLNGAVNIWANLQDASR